MRMFLQNWEEQNFTRFYMALADPWGSRGAQAWEITSVACVVYKRGYYFVPDWHMVK